MQDATLKQVKAGAGCTLYSIQFVEKEETEYEEFLRKFKDDCVLNADLLRILAIVNKIAEMGAKRKRKGIKMMRIYKVMCWIYRHSTT